MASESPPVTYYHNQQRDIHEFIFHESTREAVDGFWTKLEQLAIESQPGETYRIWMDVCESGQQPLRYFFARATEMAQKYPKERRGSGRFVLIYRDATLLGTIESFFRILNPPNIRVRFYSEDRSGEALQWVLSDRP